jgi:DNA helicase-2/ATP-dependent DNA helicase PcrA
MSESRSQPTDSAYLTSPDAPPPVVAEEQRLLDVVCKVIMGHQRTRVQADYGKMMVGLRDSLGDERLAEDQASILEQMDRMARISTQQAEFREGVVDKASPYFGHMRLQHDDGERRDILIGKQTFIKDGVRIVDWRNAPISRLFYQNRPGDDYEIEIAERMVAGQMVARRTVTVDEGELVRVGDESGTYVRGEQGWVSVNNVRPSLSGGEGVAVRPDSTRPVMGIRGHVPSLGGGWRQRTDKHLPAIASLLDPEQFEMITSQDVGLLAVQGSAGSGKTTVALHRIAYLAFQNPHRFAPHSTLVIVFSRALCRYISQVLPALGVQGVKVLPFESWVSEQRRGHFPRSPPGYSKDTPVVVSRLKRHPALLPMLQEAVGAHPKMRPKQLFDELFTNRAWLREGFERHAPGAFSADELKRVHRWCTRQHFIRDEGHGPNDEPPTLDAEDDTILLTLYRLHHGMLHKKKQNPLTYNHLVVDEAQDLSAIELTLLTSTVRKNHPITLAGDTAQRVTDQGGFDNWNDVFETLGLDHATLSPLKVSYRSTLSIMRLARAVLGHLAPDEPVLAPREGAPCELFQFRDKGAAFSFLSDVLHDLINAEPNASVAVLTRYEHQADEAYAALYRADIPTLYRVRDQDFSFAPGVEVTDIRQTKGLEFDYVILLDVDSSTFSEADSARHLLHVGMTRAAHQLWMITCGQPSPLLPDDLKPQVGVG